MGVSSGTERAAVQRGGASLEIRMLGPFRLSRRGRPVALPPSRKVRALFAYLALAQKPVARGPLCELLWDVPNDPRGELRWCLSKIRGLLDDRACRRVHTQGDTVQLDLSQCLVDVVDVLRATESGLEMLSPERLEALASSFKGEFLESLAIDGSPTFTAWLTAQRRRLRGCRTAVLEQLVTRGPDDQALVHLDTWLELAPFDQRAHECLFKALARRGKIGEADAHLATTINLFEGEGLESTSIRTAWRTARVATGIAVQEPYEPGTDTTGRGRASIAVMGHGWLNGALGTKSRTSVSARLLAATRSVAVGNLQALGERIGLVSVPAPEKSDAVVRKEPSRHPRVRTASVRREAPIEVPTAPGPVLVVASPPTAHATADAASALNEFAHEGGTVEIGAGVYDSRDADVTPPVELWPYLRTLRAGTSPAGIATFDLVIDEAGAVQSARVQVPLKRWDHVMLLSAMKTWHFRPATKDGQPVKYRKQLLVDVPMY